MFTKGGLMFNSDKVILFGIGGMLNAAINELSKMGISVSYLCDNNKDLQGKFIKGVKVLKPDELSDYDFPVLITSMYAHEISKQLTELKVNVFYDFSYAFDSARWSGHFDREKIQASQTKINKAVNLLADQQSKDVFLGIIAYRKTANPSYLQTAKYLDYFHPYVQPEQGDNIIDGGAWYGDSSLTFHKKLSGNCHSYAFEPDNENYIQLTNTVQKANISDSVHPINKGLYNKKETLYFKKEADNDMQFRIQLEHSEHKVEVTSIDQFVIDKQIPSIDFIKMDIEGAEVMALKGARNTIEKDRPKLAICIYHKFDDLWQIILLVKQLNPNYTLYIGHHSQNLFETVLYAI